MTGTESLMVSVPFALHVQADARSLFQALAGTRNSRRDGGATPGEGTWPGSAAMEEERNQRDLRWSPARPYLPVRIGPQGTPRSIQNPALHVDEHQE